MSNLKFEKEKVLIVKIDNVIPNEYNPKDQGTEEYEKIKKGLSFKGQRLPVVVREKGEKYEIIDGEQRWRACKELGFEDIIIYNEGKVEDTEAKELTIWYQQQVPFNEVSLAFLVKELSEIPEYKMELPFNDFELENFLEIAKEDWNNYESNFDPSEKDEEEKLIDIKFKVTEEEKEIIDKAFEATGEKEKEAFLYICEEFVKEKE